MITAVLLFASAYAPRISVEDDAAVIETSLLEFYKKTDWNTFIWSRGDYMAVQPDWSRAKRADFMQTLQGTLNWLPFTAPHGIKSPKLAATVERNRRALQDIEAYVKGAKTTYSPLPLKPIRSLTVNLDDRIVALGKKYGGNGRVEQIKNRRGASGYPLLICTLEPPCYSCDGHYALLKVRAPWGSMHEGTVQFYLERSLKGWKVRVAHTEIYL